MGTRYTALGKETTYGVAVAATRYLEAIASIKPDQNWIIPPPIASRAFRKCNLGPYRARGNIGDFPLEPENIGELLMGVFGSVVTTSLGGTPTAYSHSFRPADTLPSYTVRLGVEQTERALAGGLIESLTVKFSHDNNAQASAEVLSGFLETKSSIGTPTISELQALNMQNVSSSIELSSAEKKTLIYELEITIKNNIPFERGALDSRYFTTKRIGQREISGKLSIYFDDTTEYDRFIAGTEFTLDHDAYGPLISGTNKYRLGFYFGKCIYTGGVPDVKPQNEPLIIDAPFKVLYDPIEAWEGRATLVNKIASY